MKCALCGKEISEREANNGRPLVEGRVCNKCNWKVIQERLRLAKSKAPSKSFVPGEVVYPPTPESFQSIVDDQIKKYGRVGGALHDELDQAGLYLNRENKVVKKSSTESMAVIGTEGPVNTTDPMGDFERYAKEFQELIKVADAPVRKEVPVNKTKVTNGEVTGEINSMEKGEKVEQVEPISKEKKSATEAADIKLGGSKGTDSLDVLMKMAKNIGLRTGEEFLEFNKRERKPGETLYDAMLRHRAELGDDHQNPTEF